MAQMKFSVTAGTMYLSSLAFEENVEFSYDGDKSGVDSQFLCRVKGTNEAMQRFKGRYLRWRKIMETIEE